MGSLCRYAALALVMCAGCAKPASNPTTIPTTNPTTVRAAPEPRAVSIQIPSGDGARAHFQRLRSWGDEVNLKCPDECRTEKQLDEFVLLELIDPWGPGGYSIVFVTKSGGQQCRLLTTKFCGPAPTPNCPGVSRRIDAQLSIEFLDQLIRLLDDVVQPREYLDTDRGVGACADCSTTFLTWRSKGRSGTVIVDPTYMRNHNKILAADRPEYDRIVIIIQQVSEKMHGMSQQLRATR